MNEMDFCKRQHNPKGKQPGPSVPSTAGAIAAKRMKQRARETRKFDPKIQRRAANTLSVDCTNSRESTIEAFRARPFSSDEASPQNQKAESSFFGPKKPTDFNVVDRTHFCFIIVT
jgi:hypothetical protein